MDRTDWMVTGIVTAIMIFCFRIGSSWSYFWAGVCATCLFFVNIGRFVHHFDIKRKAGQWEQFIEKMETELKEAKPAKEKREPISVFSKLNRSVTA